MTRLELAVIALKRIAYGIPGADEDIWDKAILAEQYLSEIDSITSDDPDLSGSSLALVGIVEGPGVANHGSWRDEFGVRLKDTPEWVSFYNFIQKNHNA